jgi:membrane fusion protein (multidrug efflux system)
MPADQKLTSPSAKLAEAPASKRDAPETQPELSVERRPESQKPRRSSYRPWTRRGLFASLPLALIIGIYWYVTGGQVMSTDDAYVEANTVDISTDVPGIVKEVDVTDNQQVDAGQVLYRLDPLQFQMPSPMPGRTSRRRR